MGDVSEAILRCLLEKDPIDSLNLSKILKEDHQKIIGSIKSLQAIGNVIESEQQSTKCWELTAEGKEVALNGSHEALVYKAVPEKGISQSELMKIVPNAKVGFSKAMSAGWIQIDKSTNDGPKVLRKVDVIEDGVQKCLLNVENNRIDVVAENQRQELKKRKLLQEILIKSYLIKKGKEFTTTVSKPETDITPEMIASQSWKDKKFKEYNFDALGVPPDCGHLHPLMKVRAEFRQIFLEMGFTEMQTNNFIESSFWNFDALYQPQQHPARDAHDTFFISKPLKATQFPMDYLKRVKTVHEVGGYGSEGYKYTWKIEEAEKNLLRTHTTAASARILYKLAQEEEFKAGKYFSIDRVFRNETLDATHLAEFHQIEGVIVDRDLTLGDLIGILYEFFKKLGITKLRFKPAYNPYTEPSMEIFSFHEGLGKWVEVGNSGLFRPEMLLPMGFPDNVKVIGYGLSLERPTMIKYGIDNIRDLVGHKVNLQMVQDNPICRLDKSSHSDPKMRLQQLECRQEKILSSLDKLCTELDRLKSNKKPIFAITANEKKPTLSLLILTELYKQKIHFINPRKQVENFFNTESNDRTEISMRWENVSDIYLSSNKTKIEGEVDVIRFLARQMAPSYESDAVMATYTDQWLDLIHTSVLHGNNKERAAVLRLLNSHLGANKWLVGNEHSIADVVMWSALYQTQSIDSAPNHVKRWLINCSKLQCYKNAEEFVENVQINKQ